MNAPFLRPTGCPIGVEPNEWRQALSKRIEHLAVVMTALIDALDVMEGDADFEPSGDEMDLSAPESWRPFDTNVLDDSEEAEAPEDSDPAEPILGSPEQNPLTNLGDQTHWAGGSNTVRFDEAEIENEHGGDILDVPHRGEM